MSRWYRAYEGTVTDAKLGEVAMVAGCSRSVAIAAWHCILESATACNGGGNFDATFRRVAVILGEPVATIEAVFLELSALGMIENGSVVAWKKRQYESDSSTQRSRRHREKLRKMDQCNTGNADATPMQRCATPPDTDTDTDTEVEVLDAKASSPIPRCEIEPVPDEIEVDSGGAATLKPDHVVEAWNNIAARHGLARVRKLTPARRQQLRSRLKDCSVDDFTEAIAAIERSPFLRGDNERNWRITFDFLLKPSNFAKLIEGTYDRPK